MRRGSSAAGLAGLALLAACSAQGPAPGTAEEALPGLCRIGPDDGPPLADRGIGGTGAAAGPALADRGIGGTGAPAFLADRGIGGTGIVAVITGFASICLGGMRWRWNPACRCCSKARRIPQQGLRAGQLALVEAAGSGAALSAPSVRLRYEVSAPVDRWAPMGGLRVPGRRCSSPARDLRDRSRRSGNGWRSRAARTGRGGAGDAARPARAGRGAGSRRDPVPWWAAAHGRDGSRPGPAGAALRHGHRQYRGGALQGARLQPDAVATDPAAAFGPQTRRVLLESYAVAGPEGLRLGPGLVLPDAGALRMTAPLRAVVELERRAGGGVSATALHLRGLAPTGRAPVPGGAPARDGVPSWRRFPGAVSGGRIDGRPPAASPPGRERQPAPPRGSPDFGAAARAGRLRPPPPPLPR